MENKIVTCCDKDGGKHKISVCDLKFRPSVYGIIIRNEKVLMVPQWDMFGLPGGGVDLGEKIVDALVREVKEETGYDVKVCELLRCNELFYAPRYKGVSNMHAVMVYFVCEVVGGELSDSGLDAYEQETGGMAVWKPLSKLDKVSLPKTHDIVGVIMEGVEVIKGRKPA